VAVRDITAWKLKKLPKPEDVITVHYHRYDEDYDDVGIWTWDETKKHTPEPNEIYEVGRDDYGLIFQIDHGEYGLPRSERGEHGDSDNIGLLPRLGLSWDRKDGDDKFWRPDMGKDIYLIGTQNKVWAQRPEIGAQVVSAYIDAATRLAVNVSRSLKADEVDPSKITVTGDGGQAVPVASAKLVLSGQRKKSNAIELTTAQLGARSRMRSS
jgi:hypothetical protein